MAGRSVQQSAAYAALSVVGKRVLHDREQVGHDGAAISLDQFNGAGHCAGQRPEMASSKSSFSASLQ